jgi:hypothetical protein
MGLLGWLRKRPAVHVRIRGVTSPTVYFETDDAAELAVLRRALAVEPGTGAICMCPGTLVIEIGDEPPLTLHHGESLRWAGSRGNEPLRDPDAAMDWLSAHGITFVREEHDAANQRADASQREDAAWKAAMPASLLPFFDAMRTSGASERPEWTAAIEAEHPDPTARARVLLALLGSSSSPWSGHPSYESVPAALLLRMPLPALLAAIGDATDDRIAAGAARLFSSWSFGRERKRDRARIPPELRAALIAVVERGGDPDKLDAARRALAAS